MPLLVNLTTFSNPGFGIVNGSFAIPETTAGNTLVVCAAAGFNGFGGLVITDNTSDTFVENTNTFPNNTSDGPASGYVTTDIWYALNIAGGATSINFVSAGGAPWFTVYEIDPSVVDDAGDSTDAGSTSVSSFDGHSLTGTGGRSFYITVGACSAPSKDAIAVPSVNSPWVLDFSVTSTAAANAGIGIAHVDGAAGSQQADFAVSPNAWQYCTNSISFKATTPATGNIEVIKATNPSGSPQNFTFTPSWGSPFTLSDGQSNVSGPLAPGTYSVSETPIAGWTVTTSSDPTSIVVTAGNVTQITFTNTTGQIEIVKATIPSGLSEKFTFTPSWGAVFQLADGESNLSGALTAGTYSVIETPVTGWTIGTSSDPNNIVVANGAVTQVTFTNTLVEDCVPPSSQYSFLYIKSFPLTGGGQYTVALDAGGRLWSDNVIANPFVFTTLTNGIIPGTYMRSTTEDDVEYMCFSNLLSGTDIPRQYNPQPAIGGYTLDRISQVGPGAPPTFLPTTASGSQATITSWSGSGGTVTFQAVQSFTAGEIITLSGFGVSAFFNGLQFSVLGTGLTGAQFEVGYSGYSGGSDSGVAIPQYGYPISHISQLGPVPFNGQIALWSSGPGQTSAGTVWTLYYGSSGSAADPNLTAAFNSGETVYVYIVGSPFGNGTQLVTGIGSGIPPDETGVVNFITVQATSSSYQIYGGPAVTGNTGSYEQTIATLVTALPIPNIGDGDEITISGATPGGWNNTWRIVNALNAGVYAIVQTSMTAGVGTYTWEWSGVGNPVAPISGQLVTVIQTLNGNGIFNVADAVIGSVSGGPSSGTFTINNLGPSTQNVLPVAEQGQAETAGTSFQIDPGAITLGTTSNPIYGSDSGTGIVAVAGANTSIGPGTRQAVVFFETRNGLKTACSAPVTFTTTVAATYLLADTIPIGPPDVIRRWLAFTTAGPNGIAGPNFYTIDEPVSFTINNQTFLYSATYIDDNVSTSAKFTFTDSILIAGDEIDVLGNDLFSEIELGSSAWNIAYAQRMFYGLEQNKVLNFTNLSFDGGYIPNPGGRIVPLGWSVDLPSNSVAAGQAVLTSYQIVPSASGLPPNVIIFQSVNSFTAGTAVAISGTGTFLDGITLHVIALDLSGSQWAANIFHLTQVPTAISGLAGPNITAGMTLVVSPVFGNAAYINNQSVSTQATLGMIVQGAYQDAYSVPIILPNTLYSVRVAASIPSGKTIGNLVVDLTGSNAGLVSGTGNPSSYGATFGAFVLPLSQMTTTPNIYSGTLLTSPFLTGVPPGLLLRIWAQNIGVGADVLVDRIEIYPTATPLLSTNVRVSYVDNFEAFDANTGNIGLAAHNTQACYGAFELHDQLYFLQSASMQSTQDVPGVEPSNPGGGWAVHEVSNRVGTCGIHAYDYGEEWVLTACRNGVYGFNGGQPIRIDFQQREIWELINWNYGHTIWLANDLPNSRILIGVPLPTPNRWLPLAPVNKSPTSPNVILMWNYQNLDTFEEIVSGRGVHTTMFGTLAAVDMRLKMSIWQIPSPFAGFIMQPDLISEALTICNGAGNQKIYQLSADELSDDGAAINSFYATFGFCDAAKAKENPLLGLHRKTYTNMQWLLAGSGSATISAYPNYILNPKTLAFNPDTYNDTPRGLVDAPSDDYWTTLNVTGNRVFFSVQTNQVGSAFRLSKCIIVGTIAPYAASNPNS